MFDMNSIMGKIQEAQESLKKAQEDLVHLTTSAESGAGLVKVTVNGLRQLTEITLSDDLKNEQDFVMTQDLIIAATNKALADIEPQIKEALKDSTKGLLPNIPGFDPSNLF